MEIIALFNSPDPRLEKLHASAAHGAEDASMFTPDDLRHFLDRMHRKQETLIAMMKQLDKARTLGMTGEVTSANTELILLRNFTSSLEWKNERVEQRQKRIVHSPDFHHELDMGIADLLEPYWPSPFILEARPPPQPRITSSGTSPLSFGSLDPSDPAQIARIFDRELDAEILAALAAAEVKSPLP